MCHSRPLSFIELEVGLNTLRGFLASGGRYSVSGGYKQSSHSDVACYFPKIDRNCLHCQKTRHAGLFRTIIFQALTDSEGTSRAEVLHKFRQLTEADLDISWVAVLQCAILDFKLEDILKVGTFCLSALVPPRVASAFNMTSLEASALLLKKTEGWRLLSPEISDDSCLFLEERRKTLSRILESPLAELLKDDLNFSKAYFSILTQRFLDDENVSLKTEWFEKLKALGALGPKDLWVILDWHSRKMLNLPEPIANLVVPLILEAEELPDYILQSAYDYSKFLKDFELGDSLVGIIQSHINRQSQTALHLTIAYLLEAGRKEMMTAVIQQTALLKRIDFQTFDSITTKMAYRLNPNDLIKSIRDAVRKDPAGSDFMVLLSSYLPIPDAISDEKIKEIQSAAINYYNSQYAGQSHARSKVAAINNVLLRTFIKHPEVYSAISQLISARFPKKSEMVERLGLLLTKPQISEAELSKEVLNSSYLTENPAAVALLTLDSSSELDETASLSMRILEIALKTELWIPDHVLEIVIKRIALVQKPDEARASFERVVQIEASRNRAVSLNKVAYELLMDRVNDNNGLALVRALEAADIPVRNSVKHLALNESLASGELFDWGVVEGPEAEYWSQLAIIFDDVVHEINQPLLAIASWIEYLKLLEAGAPGERVLGIQGLEFSKNELASRMIHYQALTSGGTQPTWQEVDKVIVQVIEDLRSQIKSSGVVLKLETDYLRNGRWVFAPGFQFRLAIRNIIRNAINALEIQTGQREIKISIKNPFQTSSQVIMLIEDNGPGIPEELQGSIFEKGFTTKIGRGLGLGLPLAATVVRGMGGTLKLQSTSSKGSTFVIVLPAGISPIGEMPSNMDSQLGGDFVEDEDIFMNKTGRES